MDQGKWANFGPYSFSKGHPGMFQESAPWFNVSSEAGIKYFLKIRSSPLFFPVYRSSIKIVFSWMYEVTHPLTLLH